MPRSENWLKGNVAVVGLLSGMFVQTCGMVWWASSINSAVKQNATDIAEIKAQYVPRPQIVDAQNAVKDQLSDIKSTLNLLLTRTTPTSGK